MESEFIDKDSIIYNALREEYFVQHHGWRKFIELKDLGIEVLGPTPEFHKKYRITDHKKWLIHKLKHGI